MKKWTQEEINEAVRLHGLWLVGNEKGVKANLSGSDLSGSDLSGSNLRGANLRGANLRGSNLRGSDLRGSDLRGSDLRGSDIRGSDLRGSDLRGSDLRESDLRGSDLSGSNLRGSDLRESDLRGANGVKRCSVDWDGHGECGRKLTAVRIGKNDRYFCGCFAGTLKELRLYIANGAEGHKASRTKVVDFVASCMAEVKT